MGSVGRDGEEKMLMLMLYADADADAQLEPEPAAPLPLRMECPDGVGDTALKSKAPGQRAGNSRGNGEGGGSGHGHGYRISDAEWCLPTAAVPVLCMNQQRDDDGKERQGKSRCRTDV
ncbi:hypothetical protein J3458_019926 [Metarhizium acridum]|uniref:uncharacterized protein n=1 Tax=Metarhizium acridum TaxID=92637 RepID=UPI001C6B0816|nr:hypothetical protein J3458_019926 [Metarhizium acridum]